MGLFSRPRIAAVRGSIIHNHPWLAGSSVNCKRVIVFFARQELRCFNNPGFVLREEKGVSLIEIVIGIAVVTIAAAGALSFFSYGIGEIKTQGNSRAALELASTRLEQLMAADSSVISPPDSNIRYLKCTGTPCTWILSATALQQIALKDRGRRLT